MSVRRWIKTIRLRRKRMAERILFFGAGDPWTVPDKTLPLEGESGNEWIKRMAETARLENE